MRIAVDAMGGDYAPGVVVEGAVLAARKTLYEIILVGDETRLREELKNYRISSLPISIHHSSEVIGMDEPPAIACRQKKDSSIMVATQLMKEGVAEAMVSAGNSGAVMASALMVLGRLPGVDRPAIAVLIPTLKGAVVLLDVGANVNSTAKDLLQFAIMGNIYMKIVMNRESPRVGLLSIGAEEVKGDEVTVEAHRLLRQSGLNFVGNIEGRDIVKGKADVIVCDGFVGNILLKFGEGVTEEFMNLFRDEILKYPFRKMALILFKGAFRDIKRKVDYSEYGGAPLLGVDGCSIICHGSSNAKAISNAIRAAGEFVEKRVNQQIKESLQEFGK
jgi:glycerol-3-phosphate acyltransferase PlsX